MSRFDLLSLALSVASLAAIAGAAVILWRIFGQDLWPGWLELILGLLAIAAISVVIHYTSVVSARQRFRDRLTEMRQAAHRLGHGDLQVLVVEGDDDLGSLGRSLNAMSSRISRLLTAQRDLLSGVSHELRSPLARIEVSLELIDMQVQDSSSCRELIEGIRQEVQLLERHISRLLLAQRVSRDRVLLERAPLQLDALLERVLERERLRLEKLGFDVQMDLSLGECEVIGDDNALDRVASTLVDNVVRHAGSTAQQGESDRRMQLRLESKMGPLGALVRVMDRGPGLDHEQCIRAFEPFFRGDASRSDKTGGTGLGLYLVRRICKAHGGSARAFPRDGGGLVIELRLPVKGQKELKETLRVQVDADSLVAQDDPAVDADSGLDPPKEGAKPGDAAD